ncbi:GTPase required for pre-60S ribosomal subunit nuclear export and maturation [Phlyctochytrium bullatum]|nr:GTPase required for pre-60S ribosomal subunit nuclear export and maturation [Phlyctochytrium bullatum]
MGKGKKERNRVLSGSAAAPGGAGGHSLTNVTRVKGTNFYRDAKKIRQLNMLKGGKPVRNADGKIIKPAEYQSRMPSGTVSRVDPNRRWFENTRVVGSKELDAFRNAMGNKADDPYTVLLRQNKLPMSLLVDSEKVSRMHLLETDPFTSAFGPKSTRKRPKLSAFSTEDLAEMAKQKEDSYSPAKDSRLMSNVNEDGMNMEARDPIFSKGQSKRIWSELYKVIDSSDVIVHVIDARNPIGTRCHAVEQYIRKEAPHKHLVFVLNKCDLIPTWVTVWQYITLMKRIYLIDCPGIVPPSQDDSETEIVLKGVVRIENVKTPDDYIPAILERVKPEYIRRTYSVDNWEDHVDFLTQVAKKTGKLLKGAEPDIPTVSKMILNDWLRGKIPYYTPPPEVPEAESVNEVKSHGIEQTFTEIPISAEFTEADAKREETDGEKTETTEEPSTRTAWEDLLASVVGDETNTGETVDFPTEAINSSSHSEPDDPSVVLDTQSKVTEVKRLKKRQSGEKRDKSRSTIKKQKGLPVFKVTRRV